MEQEQNLPVDNGPKKNSKLTLALILVIIIVLGGGAFAYAKFVRKASNFKEVFVPTKFNSVCKYNDPELCKFINNWKEVEYMTMISTSTSKDNKTSKMTMKTEGNDNTQIVVEEDGKENYNAITLKNTTYTKDYTDNKWFKYTSNPNSNFLNETTGDVDFDEKAELAEDKTEYKRIGTEKCEKLTCYKYQVIDPEATNTTEYIFFDNKEYLLRKTESISEGTTTLSTFDYDRVTLSEPSPVKEGNPFEANLGNLTNSSSQLPAASIPSTPSMPTSSSSNEIPDNSTSSDIQDIPSAIDAGGASEIPSDDGSGFTSFE